MSAQHTPGRLYHASLMGSTSPRTWEGQSIFHCGLGLRHHSYSNEQVENARRLVACWNACQDIPIEVLEANAAGGLPYSVADQIEERVLRQQLLVALRAVVSVADRKTDEFDLAHAAIAKATGGAS